MQIKNLGFSMLVAASLAVMTGFAGAATSGNGPRLLEQGGSASANIWVDRNGGSCARSEQRGAYRDRAACGSIDAAWGACRPGDTIVLKGGVYGPQTITGDKAAPGCAVTGEGGTTIGALVTKGAFFRLNNVTVDVGDARRSGWDDSASNVTLTNVSLHGPFVSVEISGASHVSWIGGELGIAGQSGGRRVCGDDAEPLQIESADHITIDRIRFHPQSVDPTPNSCSANGFHLEMVRIDGGTSFVTIRNSTFDSGDQSGTASVFITEPGGDEDPHDLTFENNLFGTNDSPVGAFDVHANVEVCRNFTFAYNTFLVSTGAFQCNSMENAKWIGNLGTNSASSSCSGESIGNVWQDSSKGDCGSDTWVSGARGATDKLGLGGPDGFHLMPGSPAIDAGESSGYCTTGLGSRDHDGRRRQLGIRCDAGALEYAASGEAAVVASLVGTHWRRSGPARSRTLAVRISNREAVVADVRLVRGKRTIARGKYAADGAGAGSALLVLPANAAPGDAQLRVMFSDAANNTLVSLDRVQIPVARSK